MNEKILKNRDRIDNADEQIFDLLLERLDAVTAIGHIKKQEGLPVLDQERENAIYAKIDARFSSAEAGFLKSIYQSIISESKKVEELYCQSGLKILGKTSRLNISLNTMTQISLKKH